MNEEQVKEALKGITAKIQEEVIKLFGSNNQHINLLRSQAKGKVQQHTGNLEEAVKDASNKL